MSGVETYTTAVLSTSHLSRETVDLMGDDDRSGFPETVVGTGVIYDDYGYGSRVYVGYQTSDDIEMAVYRAPEELKAIMLWANKEGHRWVDFDRDGDVYEEMFPTFDW